MNNQAPPNEPTLFNYEEFSARFGNLDQTNFMETSPIRGAHSSPSVSSREYTLFGSPEPSSSSRAFELFSNRNSSPDPRSMPLQLSPIGTGIGRPILGRHPNNHQESIQTSYDLVSPRQLFPPDPAPRQEFAWPQRPALQRTSSWQTLSGVSEVPSLPDRSTIAEVPLSRSNFTPRCGRECKFCKNNGEHPTVYRSHVLRNPMSGLLICPVLRAHICEVCGQTGDNAHTRNYCPKLKEEKRLRFALPVSLKMTKRQSDGQQRQN